MVWAGDIDSISGIAGPSEVVVPGEYQRASVAANGGQNGLSLIRAHLVSATGIGDGKEVAVSRFVVVGLAILPPQLALWRRLANADKRWGCVTGMPVNLEFCVVPSGLGRSENLDTGVVVIDRDAPKVDILWPFGSIEIYSDKIGKGCL